jgi:hypothetical protein
MRGPTLRERPVPAEPPQQTRMLKEEDLRTRLRRGAPARVRGGEWEERLALFAHALLKERASQLMTGLCAESAERAGIYLQALAQLPSTERQGRLASQFGPRTEACQRLRALWAQASPQLQAELYRVLPPYHRSLFPEHSPLPGPPPPAALQAFAARLVREATR